MLSLVLLRMQQAIAHSCTGAISPEATWAMFGLAGLGYLLYLYVNFSGYMDIVIGAGVVYGIQLPENFDRPLQTADFLDFWNRWHITLSDWFKDYLFYPLLKALASRWREPRLLRWLGVATYFITFLCMGIWHGTTMEFVFYGLFLGCGVSLNKAFDEYLNRRLGRPSARALRSRELVVAFGRAVTLSYFSLALTCLWLSWGEFQQVFTTMGFSGLLAGMVLRVAIVLALDGIFRLATAGWRAICHPAKSLRSEPWLRQLGLGLRVCVLAIYLLQPSIRLPEFVYMGF